MKYLDEQQSMAISAVRTFAILLIFSCHILQGMNNLLAWWLNVGVQLFLFMSGFLLGQETHTDWKDWFVKRAKRLLPSYYVFLILIFFLYYVTSNEVHCKFFVYDVLLLSAYIRGAVPGLEHLWFISIIATCYLFVPLMQYLRSQSLLSIISFIILLSMFIYAVNKNIFPFLNLFNTINLFSFAFGYAVASAYKTYQSNKLIITISAFAVLLILVRVMLQFISPIEDNFLIKVYKSMVLVSKPIIAASIVLLFFRYCKTVNSTFKKLVHAMDKYSYELYLTHHVFILGPFSILFITNNTMVNIIVCFFASVTTAVVLKKISIHLLSYFKDYRFTKKIA
jgi:peptidoglycan/LPS O-acetylase OafA/YrhL